MGQHTFVNLSIFLFSFEAEIHPYILQMIIINEL